MSDAYTLIKAAPVDLARVCEAFEALATRIQCRDDVDRVTALQRTIKENPRAYADYCRAMGR